MTLDARHRDAPPGSRDTPAGPTALGDTFVLRMALFYGALFLIYGIHVPYLPVWLDFKDLTAAEVAVATAAPHFLRLAVTPAAGIVADRDGAHRRLIVILAWASLVVAAVMSRSSGFAALLLLSATFQITISTIMPLTETIAVSGARMAGHDYGRMRLWGSITFIGAGFVAGPLIDLQGPGVIIWLMVAGCVATIAAAHLLPAQGSQATPTMARPPMRAEAMRLVRSPIFLLYLVATSAAMGSHAMFYTFGALHWREHGISTTWISILWAIGVVFEVALFAASGSFLRRVGIKGALMLGTGGAALRWTALAFDPPLWLLVALAPLHALSYGATHLGAIHFISRAVPERASGTAQAIYSSFAAGVAQGIATLASGFAYRAFGGYGYLVMSMLAVVGLAAAIAVARLWREGMLWQDQPPAHGGEHQPHRPSGAG